MVMIPLQTAQNDRKTYGEPVDKFVPDRFLKDFITMDSNNSLDIHGTSVGKTVPSIQSMNPFGGGVTLCPGRHLAVNETMIFIATALRRFDIQLVEGQKEAKPLTSYPVSGVYPPDRDVSIRVRLRK
jgi:cytochrome P450